MSTESMEESLGPFIFYKMHDVVDIHSSCQKSHIGSVVAIPSICRVPHKLTYSYSWSLLVVPFFNFVEILGKYGLLKRGSEFLHGKPFQLYIGHNFNESSFSASFGVARCEQMTSLPIVSKLKTV